MSEIFTIVSLVAIFLVMMVIFSKEKLDYVSFGLLAAVISCFIVFLEYGTGFIEFIALVDFEPIIFIISMQIIIYMAEQQRLFQWVALKTLHAAKGNHRLFFYLICTISSFSAAILADITVAIIFVPIVIRACKILEINAGPYLFGISFTINVGSLYTPFSSSENILISAAFGVDFVWFLQRFTIFVIPTLIFTLFLLDFTMLRKVRPPDEDHKKMLLEIVQPEIVIVNRRKFLLNVVYFVAIIIGFVFLPAFLVALLGAILICLFNKMPIADPLSKIDWKIVFFFISLFLMIGCMELSGIFDAISTWADTIIPDNLFLASLIILFSIAVLSGVLAQIPTALVFITLIGNLYGQTVAAIPDIIIMAFLLGINLGSNFLPQGAACDMMVLSLAEKNNVEGFNYKALLKNGSRMTLIHLANSTLFLFLFALFTGVL